MTLPLCTASFERDTKRPVRVDNEAKGCLDDVALSLSQHPDAKLVIVGDYLRPESDDLAAQRALNVRQYLTDEKGIDPARIDLRIGDGSGKSATNTLVPAGSTFNETGTHTFDSEKVVRKGQAYGHVKAATRPHGGAPVVKPGQAPTTQTPDAQHH